LAGGFGLFHLTRYWLADFHYSASQKSLRVFSSTNEPSYIIDGYQQASQSYALNSAEPFILTQLAETAAYLAIFTSDVDATSSAQLVKLAEQSASTATVLSPHHPAHFKAVSRTFILLSAINPDYLKLADSVLQTAQSLSPTDPRLPFQRAIIAKYQNQPETALQLLQAALKLKPDFQDAQSQVQELASSSGKITP
jgi:DNA repair ATPase RecN